MRQAELESETGSGRTTERAKPLGLVLRAAAAAGAAVALVGPAPAEAAPVGVIGHTDVKAAIFGYAGVVNGESFDGLSARITETARPAIHSGDVAAWIGFGAPHAGPNRTKEWLQAGIEDIAGSSQGELFYEIALPHRGIEHVFLGWIALNSPQSIRFTEVGIEPERWTLDVNGQRRGPIFSLPAGHVTWRAGFMTESRSRSTATPNDFHYAFGSMAIRRPATHRWRAPTRTNRFTQSNYIIKDLSKTGFTATAGQRPDASQP